jgi:hypothetical protein
MKYIAILLIVCSCSSIKPSVYTGRNEKPKEIVKNKTDEFNKQSKTSWILIEGFVLFGVLVFI